jgi:AcrR family transcriptional regulator
MAEHAAVGTNKFSRKRDAILSAARQVVYRRGIKAMTFADVASQVGLNPTSITYYFRKKEDLAVACLMAGAERLNAMLEDAELEQDEFGRVRRLFQNFFAHHRAVRVGAEAPIPSFGEIRALDEPYRSQAQDAFVDLTRRVRSLFESDNRSHEARTALAHVLLEQIFWAMDWLHRYDVDDYPRVLDRACDIYFYGLPTQAAAPWRKNVLESPVAGANSDTAQEAFLIAATRLINRVGYRGASVERISAELNVTKGSFYHHNEAKEELAANCFRRSIEVERRVQRRALATEGTYWDKLNLAVSTLIDFQMSESGPLAREGLLGALPDDVRISLSERLDRIAGRFSGMIADGIAEGTIRPVDPMIAAQLLRITINAAAEGRAWVRGLAREEAPALYAKPIVSGLIWSQPEEGRLSC